MARALHHLQAPRGWRAPWAGRVEQAGPLHGLRQSPVLLAGLPPSASSAASPNAIGPPTLRGSHRSPSSIQLSACWLTRCEVGPLIPRYRVSCTLRRCAPMMEASTPCTVHADGGVCNRDCRRADDLRLRDRAVDGTRPRGAPVAGHRHIGGFVSLGRRVRRRDFGRHRHPALPAGFQPCHVGVGALRDFSKGRCAGGRELRGQDHLIHCMWLPCQVASTDRLDGVRGRGVLRSPERRVEQESWYTTTEPCSTAPPSRNDVTATWGSHATLDIQTTSGTEHSSAFGTGPAGSRRTIAHSLHPCTATHALENAGRPCTTQPR